jgi:hypothetical protein
MTRTVVAVFDRCASAQRAVQALADSGFGRDAVQVTEERAVVTVGVAEEASVDAVREALKNAGALDISQRMEGGLQAFDPDESGAVFEGDETAPPAQ